MTRKDLKIIFIIIFFFLFLSISNINALSASEYNNLGVDYFKNNNFVLAIENFEKAYQLNPSDERYRNNVGVAYWNYGNEIRENSQEYEKAITQFDKGLEYYQFEYQNEIIIFVYKEWVDKIKNDGHEFYKNKDYQKSIDTYKSALEVVDTYSGKNYEVDTKDAIESNDDIIETNYEILFLISKSYEKMGDFENALKYLNMIDNEDPTYEIFTYYDVHESLREWFFGLKPLDAKDELIEKADVDNNSLKNEGKSKPLISEEYISKISTLIKDYSKIIFYILGTGFLAILIVKIGRRINKKKNTFRQKRQSVKQRVKNLKIDSNNSIATLENSVTQIKNSLNPEKKSLDDYKNIFQLIKESEESLKRAKILYKSKE